MRERGLKPGRQLVWVCPGQVAPHAGAWIETMTANEAVRPDSGSLPMRERGLKPGYDIAAEKRRRVAPHAGAWIETCQPAAVQLVCVCRSPCGSVD